MSDSDTPRTDDNTYGGKGIIGAGYVSADFARQLERELGEVGKENDKQAFYINTLTTERDRLASELDEAEEALREVCIITGFDPSEGEGTTPQEALVAIQQHVGEIEQDRDAWRKCASSCACSMTSIVYNLLYDNQNMRIMWRSETGECISGQAQEMQAVPNQEAVGTVRGEDEESRVPKSRGAKVSGENAGTAEALPGKSPEKQSEQAPTGLCETQSVQGSGESIATLQCEDGKDSQAGSLSGLWVEGSTSWTPQRLQQTLECGMVVPHLSRKTAQEILSSLQHFTQLQKEKE